MTVNLSAPISLLEAFVLLLAASVLVALVTRRTVLPYSVGLVVLGLAVSILTRYVLVNALGWRIDLEVDSIIYASIAGLVSGLLGALYPALRAASQDPIEALSYK